MEEINEALSSEPSLLNKSAEDKGRRDGLVMPSLANCWVGWLCKIKISDPSEVDLTSVGSLYRAHRNQQMDKLLTEEAYQATCES